MPKKADELLLGLLCERQDLCFPDFEVEDEGEEYQPGNPEIFIEGCPYMELISINGKSHLFRNWTRQADGSEKGHWILSLAAGKKMTTFPRTSMRIAGPSPSILRRKSWDQDLEAGSTHS
jgi:hypothetical protein